MKKEKYTFIIVMSIVIIMTLINIIAIIDTYQTIKIENNKLCNKCGYKLLTDTKCSDALCFALDKIECDNKYVLNITYQSNVDKWGNDKYNLDKPEVKC